MATFVELTGAIYPKQIGDRRIDPLQGKSLLPIFRGETRQPPGPVEARLSQVGKVGALQPG
jgi:hypothetical protein